MQDAAIAIVFDETESQLLLVQRRDVPVWVLPGGGIDPGETAEAAVLREVKEETGLTVAIQRKVAQYSPINRLSTATHLFECRGRLQPGPPNEEARAVAFFPLAGLPNNFFTIHKNWLEDALKNQPEIIRRPLHEVTYGKLFRFLWRHPWLVLRYGWTRLLTQRSNRKETKTQS